MKKVIPDGFVENIKGKRLELRYLSLDDLDDIFDYAKHPEVALNTSWYAHQNRDETAHFIEHVLSRHKTKIGVVHIVWAIRSKKEEKTIGTLSFAQDSESEAHIDYALSNKYWGQGYMTEALELLLVWAFTYLPALKKINSGCLSRNIASVRVLEKVGFYITKRYESQRGAKFDHQILETTELGLFRTSWEDRF